MLYFSNLTKCKPYADFGFHSSVEVACLLFRRVLICVECISTVVFVDMITFIEKKIWCGVEVLGEFSMTVVS
jgi:hypothetical protein